MAGRNWIKDLVDERTARKRGEEARRRALALIAFGGADPTDTELSRFTPGVPIQGMDGTTGASPTEDMAGATADLQAQLRNEELQRAAQRNRPAVTQFRTSLALQDAGVNENNVAQARVRAAQAADQEARNTVTGDVLANPEANPLLKIDIAQKRPVFSPKLVKVRRQDGTEIYMHETPTLSGQPTYGPALDEDGQPLRVPPSASAAGPAPTALQKNAAFLARVMFAEDPDADKKAVAMLTSLKGKAPAEAWDSLTREVSRMSFGRYAKDPQRLYEKTAEIWRVARPMEMIPAEAPAGQPPAPNAAAAPTASTAVRPSQAPKPAPTNEPTAVNPQTGERLVFRNGRWQPHK